MDYLTATEFSKKWGITSRMVARYCETGRIVGAHKKGKTWLIPASAENRWTSAAKSKRSKQSYQQVKAVHWNPLGRLRLIIPPTSTKPLALPAKHCATMRMWD